MPLHPQAFASRHESAFSTPRPRPRQWAWLVGVALAVALLPACGGGRTVSPYARPYPDTLLQEETLDIQVTKTETHIELTNTTAESFGFSTLWLNQRFSRPIEGLGIGETLRLPLKEFRDQYSDPFPAGGFFATGPADLLVQTQLETLDEREGRTRLLGLIVVTDVEAE